MHGLHFTSLGHHWPVTSLLLVDGLISEEVTVKSLLSFAVFHVEIWGSQESLF